MSAIRAPAAAADQIADRHKQTGQAGKQDGGTHIVHGSLVRTGLAVSAPNSGGRYNNVGAVIRARKAAKACGAKDSE